MYRNFFISTIFSVFQFQFKTDEKLGFKYQEGKEEKEERKYKGGNVMLNQDAVTYHHEYACPEFHSLAHHVAHQQFVWHYTIKERYQLYV